MAVAARRIRQSAPAVARAARSAPRAWRRSRWRAILGRSLDGSVMGSNGLQAEPATRVVLRAIVYYAVLIAGTTFAWRYLPHSGPGLPPSLDALFGGGGA